MSSKFAPAMCLAVALALVPTVIHNYLGMVVDDGRSTAAISPFLGGFVGRPSDKDAEWGQRWLNSRDWFERRYSAGGDEVVLTVSRSYDWKGLYHHPELAVARGLGLVHDGVHTIRTPFPITVHVMRPEREGEPGAAYALIYDGEFVDDPIRFQVVRAGELLFRGPKALTLAFARDVNGPAQHDVESRPSTRVLVAAVQQFLGRGSVASSQQMK